MTDLSPAAQAVLDAFARKARPEPNHQCDAIAAALRSAADQVVPAEDDYKSREVFLVAMNVRHKLVAIAAELEAHP